MGFRSIYIYIKKKQKQKQKQKNVSPHFYGDIRSLSVYFVQTDLQMTEIFTFEIYAVVSIDRFTSHLLGHGRKDKIRVL